MYDIGSTIKNEKGIKLFSINLGTSTGNIDTALKIIDSTIEKIRQEKSFFNIEKISNNSRMLKLKRELKLEKSIMLCKELCVYEIMFDSAEVFFKETEDLDFITNEEILSVINRMLSKPSIQIIKPSGGSL